MSHDTIKTILISLAVLAVATRVQMLADIVIGKPAAK